MNFGSYKALKSLLRHIFSCPAYRFTWNDYFLPTTLQLSPLVELLVEPLKYVDNIREIELGLHEALVNAVIHGNASDPSKSIRVRRIFTPNWYIWQIQDEGNGLPIEGRDHSLPVDLKNENGRGLFLIHHCFDDVRWSYKGNRLQLALRKNKFTND